MADSIKPRRTAADTGRRSIARQSSWQVPVARCRAWLREFSQRLAWNLIARHGFRRSYCPVYRTSLAVLLHGLDRDIALSLLCEPVHCYSRAAGRSETGVPLTRSPSLKR